MNSVSGSSIGNLRISWRYRDKFPSALTLGKLERPAMIVTPFWADGNTGHRFRRRVASSICPKTSKVKAVIPVMSRFQLFQNIHQLCKIRGEPDFEAKMLPRYRVVEPQQPGMQRLTRKSQQRGRRVRLEVFGPPRARPAIDRVAD